MLNFKFPLPNLKSPIMQFLHYLSLYIVLIWGNIDLLAVLFFLYLLPMIIFMVYTEILEETGDKPPNLAEKWAFKYSVVAIFTIIGLAIASFMLNYYASIYFLVMFFVMLFLLIGFSSVTIMGMFGEGINRFAKHGIFLATTLLAVVIVFLGFFEFFSNRAYSFFERSVFISIPFLLIIMIKLFVHTSVGKHTGSPGLMAKSYIGYVNARQFKQAYAMLADQLQTTLTLESFTAKIQDAFEDVALNDKLAVKFSHASSRQTFDKATYRHTIEYNIIFRALGKIRKEPLYVVLVGDTNATKQWRIYHPKLSGSIKPGI